MNNLNICRSECSYKKFLVLNIYWISFHGGALIEKYTVIIIAWINIGDGFIQKLTEYSSSFVGARSTCKSNYKTSFPFF